MAITTLIPKIIYGPGPTTITLTEPMKPWALKNKTIGGYGKASSGVPEALLIRRERHLSTTLTIREAELAQIQAWLTYAQDNAAAFHLWLDKSDATTDYNVYLEKPHLTEDTDLNRHSDYLGAYVLDITVCTVDGSLFTNTLIA